MAKIFQPSIMVIMGMRNDSQVDLKGLIRLEFFLKVMERIAGITTFGMASRVDQDLFALGSLYENRIALANINEMELKKRGEA